MRALVSLLFSLAAVAPACAQQLTLGSVPIALGQSRATVMASLAEFNTSSIDPNEMVLVASKGREGDSILGAVLFKEGRVVLVQKTWAEYEGVVPPVEVAKTIHAAIESASSQARSPGVVRAQRRHMDGGEVQTLTFEFGNRRIQVTTAFGIRGTSETVRVAEEVFSAGE